MTATVGGELTHATLCAVTGSDKGKELQCTLNPTDYTITAGANWQRKPQPKAKTVTKASYQGTNPLGLKFSLLLDAVVAGDDDISGPLETLLGWVSKPGSDKEPPILQLRWGAGKALAQFNGFLKQLEIKCTMLHPSGAPLRATVSLTLEEQPIEAGKQNPTSGSLVGGRSHVVGAGETLQSLAYGEYHDPTRWRAIAERNGIDDPLRVQPGTSLVIPTDPDGAGVTAW